VTPSAQVSDRVSLPRRTLRPGTKLYRIHRNTFGPWFFDGSGAGRFDPVGTDGCGACYWSEQPLGAWIEVFRARRLIPATEIASRCLATVELLDPLVVVDLTTRRALAAGVTAATTAGHDYSEAQAIADGMQVARAGIRWRLRHDLRQILIGVAIFGPEQGSRGPKGFSKVRDEAIPTELADEACRLFGYEVLPDPPA
jgi:RES domain-containing protein